MTVFWKLALSLCLVLMRGRYFDSYDHYVLVMCVYLCLFQWVC